jgi:sulfate adenylyltransferase subunit 1
MWLIGCYALYKGQTILEHLEALEPADVYERGQARFPCKLWFDQKEEPCDFRGYAGKLYGNNIKVGDAVTVPP